MIENLGKPINPSKVDHRIFWVRKGTGKIKEISFDEQKEMNHKAFENDRAYPKIVRINDKVVSLDAGDYVFNFVRADLEVTINDISSPFAGAAGIIAVIGPVQK